MLQASERQAYTADHVAEFVHRLFEERVVFYDGEGELAPGLSLHPLPGHTMGMQALKVTTARGALLLASDAAHYYEHWIKRRPSSICWSREALMRSYRAMERLAESEDHVIPGHDPLVRPALSGDRECIGRRCRAPGCAARTRPRRSLQRAGVGAMPKTDTFFARLAGAGSARLAGAGPIVMDGALNTELARKGFTFNTLDWLSVNLDRPAVIAAIHRDYAEAGAELHIANSFSVGLHVLEDFGLAGRFEA